MTASTRASHGVAEMAEKHLALSVAVTTAEAAPPPA